MARPKKSETAKEDKKPNIDPNRFLEIDKGIRLSRVKMDEAVAEHRVWRKRMKDAGFNMKAYAAIEAFRNMQVEDREMHVRDVSAMSEWLQMPIGSQGMLFGATDGQQPTDKSREEHAQFQASADGYIDGRDNNPREGNPHPAGSALFVSWDTGWLSGQDALKSFVAESGEKPASSKRKRRSPGEVSEASAGA